MGVIDFVHQKSLKVCQNPVFQLKYTFTICVGHDWILTTDFSWVIKGYWYDRAEMHCFLTTTLVFLFSFPPVKIRKKNENE